MQAEGELIEQIPEGYEVYENPHAQVFLRKIQPRLITDKEIAITKAQIEIKAVLPYLVCQIDRFVGV